MYKKELAHLQKGGVVCAPAETVYGLLASRDSAEILTELKGRSENFITLVNDASEITGATTSELNFAKRYWAADLPLTVVFTHDGCAYRKTTHPVTRELVRGAGPLYAPSANPKGLPPAVTEEQARRYYGNSARVLIIGGECGTSNSGAKPSTVVKFKDGAPVIIRQGGVYVPDKRIVIGLTGNSGAGKSRAGEIFRKSGFDVINCDGIAHTVIDSPACAADIEKLLQGRFTRKEIAARVFADHALLSRYNKAVFPHIIAEIARKTEKCVLPVVLDAPTLYEADCGGLCTHALAVTAREDVRLARILKRDGITEAQARLRMSADKPTEFYSTRGAAIIDNSDASENFENKILHYIEVIISGDSANRSAT